MTTRVESIAAWACELEFSDLPHDVIQLARAQKKSVIAAIAASMQDAASIKILRATHEASSPGPAPLIGTSSSVRVEDALFSACAMSIALDFDDYVCFGHTGHSSVLVPTLLASETSSSGKTQIVAQVIANEIGARLGGACLIGPQNGQLWSFIHCAEAALASGKLLGLTKSQMAHALAISLYQAPRATTPGFMAPDSKLLTAAEPAISGLRAARLASYGVTGPLDVLDHPDGFLSAFAHAPIRGILGNLGEGWATKTLCVKVYPGCAYLDTTLDALDEIGRLDYRDIERVTVEAGMLTFGMNSMSAEYAQPDGTTPSPVTVNFSIPWNVAAMVIAGELTPRELNLEWMTTHSSELTSLVERIRLSHDWDLTRSSVTSFNRLVPVDALIAEAGLGSISRTISLARTRGRIPTLTRIDPIGTFRDLRGISSILDVRTLAMASPGLIAALVRQGLGGLGASPKSSHPAGTASATKFWDPEWLDKFVMKFPARVKVKVGGKERVNEVAIPRGGCGHPNFGPILASQNKFRDWAPNLWGDDRSVRIENAIDADYERLHALLETPATVQLDKNTMVSSLATN